MDQAPHLPGVYLLHFAERINPLHPCQHYVGSAADIADRLDKHAAGTGARLCQVANARSITWQWYVLAITPTAQEARLEEKRIKAQHNNRQFCPHCQQHGPTPAPALTTELYKRLSKKQKREYKRWRSQHDRANVSTNAHHDVDLQFDLADVQALPF